MRIVLPHEVRDMDESEFVSLNVRLVHSVCQSIFSEKIKRDTGLDYEDLVQVGLLGLIKAKRNFDPDFGTRFSTYAVPIIRGEILRHVLLNGNVHVPRQIKEAFFKIAKAGLLKKDDETISEQLGLPIKSVKKAKSYRLDVSSLNMMVNEEDGDATLEYWLTTGVSAADEAEDNITVQEFLKTLSPMERKIWETYRDTNCGNQSDIAAIVGVSQVQVSRLLKRIHLKAEDFGKRIGVRS